MNEDQLDTKENSNRGTEGQKKRYHVKKANSKRTEANLFLSAITLNVNGLSSPIKMLIMEG